MTTMNTCETLKAVAADLKAVSDVLARRAAHSRDPQELFTAGVAAGQIAVACGAVAVAVQGMPGGMPGAAVASPAGDGLTDAQALTRVSALLEAQETRLKADWDSKGGAWSVADNEICRRNFIQIRATREFLARLPRSMGGPA